MCGKSETREKIFSAKNYYSKIWMLRIGVKLKLSIITKKFAVDSVIRFLKNRFNVLWFSERPSASVGDKYKINTKKQPRKR